MAKRKDQSTTGVVDKPPKRSATATASASTTWEIETVSRASSSGNTLLTNTMEIKIPLNEIVGLDTFRLRLWGVGGAPTHVWIRVQAEFEFVDTPKVSFCVHLTDASHIREHEPSHVLLPVDEQIPTGYRFCGQNANLLTYALTRLVRAAWTGKQSLDVVREKVVARLTAAPAAECLVCRATHKVLLYRPTTCRGQCSKIFERAPLVVRLSPFLAYPEVLDVLLCCVHSACAEGNDMAGSRPLLPVCPLSRGDIIKVLSQVPSFNDWTVLADLEHSLAATSSDQLSDLRELLSWLADQFKGCLVPSRVPTRHFAIPDAIWPHATCCENQKAHWGLPQFFVRFVLLDYGLDATLFLRRALGEGERWGEARFHGTKARNAFSIVSEGLRNMASHGLQGITGGIWLSSNPQYSLDYSNREHLRPWPRSRFQTRCVTLFGCETAKSDKISPISLFREVTQDRHLVRIKYLFLVARLEGFAGKAWKCSSCGVTKPFDTPAPEDIRRTLRDRMSQTFAAISIGDLKTIAIELGL